MRTTKVLVASPDLGLRERITGFLRGLDGYVVPEPASSVYELFGGLDNDVEIIVTEPRFGDGNVLDVLNEFQPMEPQVRPQVLVLAHRRDEELAVTAVTCGASDLLLLPLEDLPVLDIAIGQMVQRRDLETMAAQLGGVQ